MIKLNNKNITYVALADTNNSLKAPKEIWYADSNNSVKLVYRRKDALIEGEDYEKYHWLKGDGSAYIDTNVTVLTGSEIKCIISNDGFDNSSNRLFGRESVAPYYNSIVTANLSNLNTIGLWLPSGGNVFTFTGKVAEININLDSLTVQVNNSTPIQYSGTYNRRGISLYLFTDNFGSFTSSKFNGKISKFIISDTIDLIPCKLLKPVPKWLDANGIRRQVGECGMIDLVSGKFYGNVNSSGTFTVENYYERKEWLIGDGSAYITLDVNIYRETISAVLYPLPAGGSEKYAWMYSYSVANAEIRAYVDKHDRLTIRQGLRVNNTPPQLCYSQLDGEFDITIKRDTDANTIFVVNGGTRNVAVPCDDRFDITSKISLICDGTRVKTFETDNYNLIPCTLTMDLPASMDANNIARTKGTSGMWDLVSDKFYGNVANSGTFKAVNLAEGVDYEVHQWIVKTGGSYISIPINLWKNRFDMCIEAVENYSYFSTRSKTNSSGRCMIAYNSGDGSPYILIAFREGGSSHITELRLGQALSSNTISIFQKDGIATGIINGVEYQDAELIESSWNYDIECQVPLGKTQYFKVYNEDGTYRSNLIPVKLLRSIPAKYDGNGIARQAGECGMYDTVNDVFYGNVASSGSFSVSDDE